MNYFFLHFLKMAASQNFVQMINHPNYEIMVEYPHTIRRIDNKREVSECKNPKGYIVVGLQDIDMRRKYRKHRLIAEQFLPNPDGLPQIDNINHNRSDNRIENLRWCSASTNQFNKSSNKGFQYEFLDDLPDDTITVNEYNNHRFENYYYSNDVFYFFNGIQYRRLKICEDKRTGALFVNAIDIENKLCHVYYAKFKKQYDLL